MQSNFITGIKDRFEKSNFFRTQFEEGSKLNLEEIKARYKKSTEKFLKDEENKFEFVRFIIFEVLVVTVLDERGGTIDVPVVEGYPVFKMKNNSGVLEGEVEVLDEDSEPTKVKVNMEIANFKNLVRDGLVVIVDCKDK